MSEIDILNSPLEDVIQSLNDRDENAVNDFNTGDYRNDGDLAYARIELISGRAEDALIYVRGVMTRMVEMEKRIAELEAKLEGEQ